MTATDHRWRFLCCNSIKLKCLTMWLLCIMYVFCLLQNDFFTNRIWKITEYTFYNIFPIFSSAGFLFSIFGGFLCGTIPQYSEHTVYSVFTIFFFSSFPFSIFFPLCIYYQLSTEDASSVFEKKKLENM